MEEIQSRANGEDFLITNTSFSKECNVEKFLTEIAFHSSFHSFHLLLHRKTFSIES